MLRKLVIILAAAAMASNAYAGATTVTSPCLSNAADWATANIKFTPSKSVILGYTSGIPASDSGTNSSLYAVASKNSAGDAIFGATSASTSIVFSKNSAGGDLTTDHIPTLPTDASDSTITGGAGNWSIL